MPPNERAGLDAGRPLLLAIGASRPCTTQRACSVKAHAAH